MSKIQPLYWSTKLAGNPRRAPQWAVKVSTSEEGEILCADPKATRAMVALMDMQAVLGGAASHWGGPSAFAELMSATFALVFSEAEKKGKPWHELFHIINDAGHCENGLYALKANYGYGDLTLQDLKGFRSIQSSLTGHGEAHLYPEGVYLSNGPLGSGLPQSQGLAMAEALSGSNRLTVTSISDGAAMEGEAKEAFAAIPGLAAKGRLSPFVLVISDNNTKLSGRIEEQSFSMGPTFNSLNALGWNVISLEEGNDLDKSVKTLNKAFTKARNNPLAPIAVHAKTVKGYGVSFTAESSTGGHGFPIKKVDELRPFLEEIYQGEEIPNEFQEWLKELENYKKPASSANKVKMEFAEPVEKVQVGVANAMKAKREEGFPVVSVSADLQGSTGVAPFHKAFPEDSFDVGVAEANMISSGAGLSKQGFIPVVDTFSQFGTTKGALPLIMANLSEAPVIGVFSHAGFQDAADGASHQSLSYLAMTGAIPYTDVYCLTSSAEAGAYISQAIELFKTEREDGRTPRSQIFFLGRETFPCRYLPENYSYKLGQAQLVRDTAEEKTKSVTLVATGPLLHQALLASEALKEKGIGCLVVNPSRINHPDLETLTACVQRTNGHVLTVEDHQVTAGMGAMISHALIRQGLNLRLKSLGVQDEFGQSAYKALELYQKHGLSAESVTQAALKLLKN